MGASGLVILFSVVWPIASYEKKSSKSDETFVSPVVQGGKETASLAVNEVDYTKASNWFPEIRPLAAIISTLSASQSNPAAKSKFLPLTRFVR